MLSPSDTAIVFLLALLLFGPEQLPRIARQLGEAMRHMQNTTQTFMNEMERAARVSEQTPPRPALEAHAPPQETNIAAHDAATESTTVPPEAPTA
jgi:sec-independent protein translocase protein TatB